MSWQQELDELVQTAMAFARDAGRDRSASRSLSHVSASEQTILDTLKQVVEPRPVFSPMISPVSEREQIRQRVANFKTHQQKIAREREDYYLQMKAAILTSLATQV